MRNTRVAGMAATLLNLGTRAAMELARGAVQEVIVRGENGYAVVLNAPPGRPAARRHDESSQLGLIFFDMREAIRRCKKSFKRGGTGPVPFAAPLLGVGHGGYSAIPQRHPP